MGFKPTGEPKSLNNKIYRKLYKADIFRGGIPAGFWVLFLLQYSLFFSLEVQFGNSAAFVRNMRRKWEVLYRVMRTKWKSFMQCWSRALNGAGSWAGGTRITVTFFLVSSTREIAFCTAGLFKEKNPCFCFTLPIPP